MFCCMKWIKPLIRFLENPSKKTKWIRPLMKFEEGMVTGSKKYDMFAVTVWMGIETSQPLKKEAFKDAFLYLSRTSENLRVKVNKRDERLWFAEMETEMIDWEICRGISVSQARENIEKEKCNLTSGPLWKAAVLDHEIENKYTIFLYFSHVPTDGYTIIKTAKKLKTYLENYLHEEQSDMSELGSLTHANEVVEKIKEAEMKLLKDETVKSKSLKEYQSLLLPNQANNLLFKPFSGSVSQEQIKDSLTKQETELLLCNCKEMRVTINSALATALNVAYVKFFRKNGYMQDIYKLSAIHYIDLRRHLNHGNTALGVITNFSVHSNDVSVDMLSSFWEYARILHMDLYPELTGEKMLEQRALREMFPELLRPPNSEMPFYTYISSNVSKIYFGPDRKVKVISFDVRNQLVDVNACYLYLFYIFNESLCCSIDFIPDYIERNIVESLLSCMMQTIKDSLTYPGSG